LTPISEGTRVPSYEALTAAGMEYRSHADPSLPLPLPLPLQLTTLQRPRSALVKSYEASAVHGTSMRPTTGTLLILLFVIPLQSHHVTYYLPGILFLSIC
jgi:hypothetical protein